MAATLSLIRSMEEAAFSAWPALAQVLEDGWVLRFANGHSMRANSANPTYPALGDTDTKIDRVETWYRSRTLPTLFRLTPLADPSDLDQQLAARGYRKTNPGRALYLPVLAALASPLPLPASVSLRLDAGPHDGWLEAYLSMAQLDAGRTRTLTRVLDGIVPAVRFGWLSEDGRPLAAAYAVVQDSLMSTYNVVTAPAVRRRGLMRALLHRLTSWAMAEGATAGGLFLVGGNEAAAALYERLGYQELYGYHYRVAPVQ